MKKNNSLAAVLPLFLFSGLYYAAQAVYGPYTNAYLDLMNVDAARIGLLSAMGAVSGILSQILWAEVSDRTGKRRLIIFALALGTAIFYMGYGTAKSYAGYAFFTIMYYFFLMPVMPLGDSIVVNATERRGIEYSLVRMTGTMAYVFVVFFVGRVLTQHPRSMFPIAGGLLAMLAVCALFLDREGEKTQINLGAKNTQAEPEEDKHMSPEVKHTIIFMFCASLVCYAVVSMAFSFISVLIQGIGYTQAEIGVANTVSSLSEVPLLLCSRRLYRRFGVKIILYGSLTACCIRLVLCSFATLPMIYIGQGLQGVCFIMTYYCQVMYLNEHAPRKQRARWFSIFGISQSCICVLLGAMLGGRLVEGVGIQNAYLIYGAVALLAVALLAVMDAIMKRKSQNETPTTTAS